MQTNPDDPRVKLMQKWSQNMPAYGMQGASLRARPGGGEDDDDDGDDDARSTRSAFSASSSMSTRSNSFISVKKNRQYIQRVRTTPPNPAHGSGTTQHATAQTVPANGSQVVVVTATKGKNKKNKKNKTPKSKDFNVMVLDKSGWVPILVTKENARSKITQAIVNLTKKTMSVWGDLKTQEHINLFGQVYNEHSEVIAMIGAFAAGGGGYQRYNDAINALVQFQIKLKSSIPEKYAKQPMILPYNTNMEKFISDAEYVAKAKNIELELTQYHLYNTAKLVLYFVKSLASWTADKNGPIPEDKIKEMKAKDKKISKENMLREVNRSYDELHGMIDILSPWVQAIPRATQLLKSKDKGAAGSTSHLRYTGRNKYAGIENGDT